VGGGGGVGWVHKQPTRHALSMRFAARSRNKLSQIRGMRPAFSPVPSPIIVKLFPAPVWPYAKMAQLKPRCGDGGGRRAAQRGAQATHIGIIHKIGQRNPCLAATAWHTNHGRLTGRTHAFFTTWVPTCTQASDSKGRGREACMPAGRGSRNERVEGMWSVTAGGSTGAVPSPTPHQGDERHTSDHIAARSTQPHG
jgi:hypothetical protein